MEEIKIEKIVRSDRKTIMLEISDRATLIVKAPLYVSDEEIYEVINKHSKWINKKIEILKKEEKILKKDFISKEFFLYLGESFRLFLINKQKEALKFDQAFYLRKDMEPYSREIFIKWYKKEAKRFISERVIYYSNITGIKFNKLRITSAKKRWGSCSYNGNLNFTYRLIMAPIFVIDYVVVHELCHIVEHNHSEKFWGNVRVILPDYKKARIWLREKGKTLFI